MGPRSLVVPQETCGPAIAQERLYSVGGHGAAGGKELCWLLVLLCQIVSLPSGYLLLLWGDFSCNTQVRTIVYSS